MIPFWSIIVGLFLLDLATKSWVRAKMFLGQEISLLPFFSLTHVENTGVAFGMFQGRNTFFLMLGVVVIGFLIFMGLKTLKTERNLGLIFAVIIGGALGNIWDRILYGRVTDFLDFFIGNYHWPTFNVADSAICVGAALMVFQTLKSNN